jgi:hypothetical protein
VTRKDYIAIADAFVAGYRATVEPYQQPAAFGIRRHAWKETVNHVAATLKANSSSFDLARFRNHITNNAGLEPGFFAQE